MSDIETKLQALFPQLDDPNEKLAILTLEELRAIFKNQGMSFSGIAQMLDEGKTPFMSSKHAGILGHLDDENRHERLLAFRAARSLGSDIFSRILNDLNLLGIAQQFPILQEELGKALEANQELSAQNSALLIENGSLRRQIKPFILKRLWRAVARNITAIASNKALRNHKKALTVADYLISGLGALAAIKVPLIAPVPIAYSLYRLVSGASPFESKQLNGAALASHAFVLASSFALILTAAIKTEIPQGAKELLFKKVAIEIVSGHEISNISKTYMVQSWLDRFKKVPKTVQWTLKKYGTEGDSVLVHVWANDQIKPDKALRLGPKGEIIEEPTPQQRIEQAAYDGGRARRQNSYN